jgi:hypothetical protein
MEAAKRRREKKRKKKKKGEGKKTKKGEQGRKRKKRRKKKKKRKRKDEEGKKRKKEAGSVNTNMTCLFSTEEELEVVQPPPEDHFYPTPRQLRAKRLAYPVEQNPVKCSICEGVHYRTKRNFAANLKIIMNINAALGTILDEMRGRLRKINGNLNRVKKNLVLMEDTYEGIFRKVNRLIA